MLSLLMLAATPVAVPAVEREAILSAAGAVKRGKRWAICGDDPNAAARIDRIADLNGDGRVEAIVSEDGSFCHGMTGTGFVLLGKLADGKWKKLYDSTGIPEFLKTKGVAGWPDLSVGGPGFCFPVLRWNGRAYAYHRSEYQGRRCKP